MRRPKDPIEPVGRVGGVVEKHAHVRHRVDVPTRWAVEKGGIKQDTDRVPPSHHGDLAHHAAVYQFLDPYVDRVVPHLKAHAELDPVLVYRFDDPIAVCQRRRHGLLQQDVLACRCRPLDERCVTVGLHGHDHGIDPGIVDHVICVRAVFQAVLLRRLLPTLGIVIPGSDEFHVIKAAHYLTVHVRVSVRVTKDANPYFFHPCVPFY